MRRKLFALPALTLLLALPAGAQTSGSDEGAARRTAALPRGVLRVLAADERVRQCRAQAGAPADISSWFAAERVRLGGAGGGAGYVVTPEEGCLLGANIKPFWVFAPAPGGHRLVLKTHALSLTVERTRARGYRDISIAAATAAVVREAGFRFDGRRYEPRWCRSRSIEKSQGPGGGRYEYYRCGGAEKPY